jgi:integrase
VPPKYLQDRMGHKNLEVTMRFYLHLTDKMQEKGSDILKNIFEEENKEGQEE